MTRADKAIAAAHELNASDPARYTKPQPNVPDYCTADCFLVYDYATCATVLVPRSMYAKNGEAA